jgi:hypothetical protein
MQTLDGYWPSPWPAEDGGPARRQVPAAAVTFPARGDGPLLAHHRALMAATMVVLRDPGEVFVLAHTLGPTGTVSWLERIDPESLGTIERSPDLDGGPFWPGGVAAHANGSLYVTYGRWCHRLGPDCVPIASGQLPRDRPYNSLVVLPDGHLVMKDIGGGAEAGPLALPAEHTGSELVVLEPDGLEIVARHELAEGSVARLSMEAGDRHPDGAVYVVGVDSLQRLRWDPATVTLEPDHAFTTAYRTRPGQGFGWDVVLTDDDAWFLDDGAGTEGFGPSLRGKGVATVPLSLTRVPLDTPDADTDTDTDTGERLVRYEVSSEPGGIVANPPVVDTGRRIAIGYDSGNGVVTAWHYGDADEDRRRAAEGRLDRRWSGRLDQGGHPLLLADQGVVAIGDFDHDGGTERVALVDIETGDLVDRVATGSPVQSVLFPAPGWHGDLYGCTFTTLTRIHR